MSSMNACQFTGRLGKDPELRAIASGDSVCNFSLAVDGYGNDAPTLWLNVTVWGRAGENAARFLSKGREVAVSGRVSVREYEKRDGGRGYSVDLRASDVTFIGGSREDGGFTPRSDVPVDSSDPGPDPASAQAAAADDDIPF